MGALVSFKLFSIIFGTFKLNVLDMQLQNKPVRVTVEDRQGTVMR